MKQKIFSTLAAVLAVNSMQAQVLRFHVDEPSQREHAMLVVNMNMNQLEFDAKGNATFAGDTLTESTRAYVSLAGSGFYVVLEPGKTLTVNAKGSGKRMQLSFKGANAYAADLAASLGSFLPTKNVSYETMNPRDTLSFPDAWALYEQRHKHLLQLAKQEKDDAKRAQLLDDIHLRDLNNRISMQSDFCRVRGLDEKTDAQLVQLMAQVDPNDERFLEHSTLQSYLYWKMPIEVSSTTNIDDYAQQYIRTLAAEVSNPTLRHLLLENHVNQCLGAEELDLAAFWALVEQQGDSEVVQTYQYIVDARKSTQSGMQCPDVTFSDLHGNPSRLSDHFGRVLYIDLWATWCGPCCMEIPYIEKLVEHYKDDSRVEFISISLDADIEAWEKKLTEDQPAWAQYHVDRDEERLLSSQWGVKSIPRFLIINADGTICSSDAFRPSASDFQARLDAILDAQK